MLSDLSLLTKVLLLLLLLLLVVVVVVVVVVAAVLAGFPIDAEVEVFTHKHR